MKKVVNFAHKTYLSIDAKFMQKVIFFFFRSGKNVVSPNEIEQGIFTTIDSLSDGREGKDYIKL